MAMNNRIMQVRYSQRENSQYYGHIDTSAKYALLMNSFEGATEIPLRIPFHTVHHIQPEGVTLVCHVGQASAEIDFFGNMKTTNKVKIRLEDHIRKNGPSVPRNLY